MIGEAADLNSLTMAVHQIIGQSNLTLDRLDLAARRKVHPRFLILEQAGISCFSTLAVWGFRYLRLFGNPRGSSCSRTR